MIIFGDTPIADKFETVIRLKKSNNLPQAVADHPDMNVCIIDNTAFLEKNSVLADTISKKGYNIVFINETFGKKYPDDVYLNCKAVGNTVIMNKKTVSNTILKYCEQSGKSIIDVPQGYAACSTLALNENTFITADKGIYSALINSGKNTLLIKEGYIKIKQYNYGFIGGASGFIDNTLYFFGDITVHPDFQKIDIFLKQNNVNYNFFDFPLTDIGGCIQI